MKILFATKNPAKIKKYSKKLEPYGIEIISIRDLNIDLDIDESGNNAIENATIKAKAYYEATGMITVGLDDNLYIENLPDEKQPGTHVRRINGKELDDDEMIDYYTNMAKEYGGRLDSKWVYGMVLYDEKNTYEHTWSKDGFYFTDTPCEKRNPGYPLDSITVWPKYNQYWLELSEEQKQEINNQYNNDGVEEFITSSLNISD
ncbi:MAG: non-canonical purine NTP pyrophosphatase [Clostridia bacterium]|nr:non-canonical purine NTP pyrophosphatase [Clostridia bacterium]